MIGFMVKRAILLLPLMLVVSLVVFLIVHFVPGDPVDALLQPGATAEARDLISAQYGLDRPLWVQYVTWMANLFRGEMGTAIVQGRDVAELIAENLPYSLSLGFAALVFSMVAGIGLGMIAAYSRDRFLDHASMTLTMAGATIPTFFLGFMLMLVFAVWLHWFPVSGSSDWRSLVLPTLTVGIGATALVARVVRVAIIEASQQDFITLLHAKGMPAWYIQIRYVLRLAMIPVITILGLRLGWVLGGAVTAEYIFARPGLGSLLIRGLAQRDYPLIQACLLMLSVAVLFGTYVADVLQALVDPRARETQR